MIETRIPIVPDTSTTLTDETTEHIVNRKVTIKIDRDYLKKKIIYFINGQPFANYGIQNNTGKPSHRAYNK